MKKFIIRVLFFVIPILVIHLWLGSFADGNTDDNYRLFTHKSSNIIMGDSRGAQAVVPEELNKKFRENSFDNFSLNITYSPYGEIYLDALKRKLKKDTKDGIFILTVDPWNLSQTDAEDKLEHFSEYNSPLRTTKTFVSPNYEYLLKHYNASWYQIYRDRESKNKSRSYLHPNGWLEITIEMDSADVAKRTAGKTKEYVKYAENYKHSAYRMQSLENTVNFLKKHGKVYLVRIPASDPIMEIENSYWKEFNADMQSLANKNGVAYFDFSAVNDQFQYTDGNHMYKESSKVFTQRIADSIQSHQKR